MKIKRLLTIIAVTAIGWSSAMAVPAKPGNVTVTQSDGTTLTLRAVGDEWHHSVLTTDGLTVRQADNGDFYYLLPSGLSTVRAHDVASRTAAEMSFVALNASQMTPAVQMQSSKKARANRAPKRVGSTQVPTSGSPKVPIILVQYADIKFKNSKSTFVSQYTSGSNSVYQYFYDQSNGQYQPQYDVYGPYTLSKNRVKYGGNDSSGNDVGIGLMVGEAIQLANGDADFSQYDNDGDGECDVMIVVYAGVGEAQASTTVTESVWPCQWSLSSAGSYGDGSGSQTLDGVKIDRFAVFNELYGSSDSGTAIDGVGTFCHEFSHCLGLPDFYETTYSHGYYGMGSWSLMNSGCYNNNGYTPCGYSGYEKDFMGWITLQTPTPGKRYTLPAFNQKSADTDVALKIVNDSDPNEYYVVENRQPQGWDSYQPSTGGLLITHVTYDASAWSNNEVNNYSMQRMCPIPADNVLSDATESADLWPYGTHTELTNSSTPPAKVNTGSYMSKPLTEMVKNSDGTVSFYYMKGSGPTFETFTPEPAANPASNVTSTSFTAQWTDQTDATNVESYTLKVYDASIPQVVELINADFTSANPWTTTTGYAALSNGYTQLGSSSQTGSVTSPALNLTDYAGVTTVTINAKYYNTDASSMKVSLVNASGTELATQTFTLTNSVAAYTTVFTGNASADNYIKIESTARRKRVQLASVVIYGGDATAASAPRRAVVETGDANSRTITGITTKSYTVSNLNEGATYKFKVKAIYTGGYESDWSTESTVALTGGTTTPTPEIITDNDALTFGEVTVGESATVDLGILASDLQDDVVLSLTDQNNVFTISTATVARADAENGATVTVGFTPAAAGSYTATLTIASQGAESVTVALSGSAVEPTTMFTPVMLTANSELITSEGFTAQWTDQTDSTLVASYTLQVDGNEGNTTPGELVQLTTEDFSVPANTTWTKGGSTYNETSAGYLRLGTGSATGSITGPATDLTDYNGVATIVVNAKSYGSDGSSMKVSLVNVSGTELASETVELTDEDADYTVVLTGNASADNYVRIASLAAKKRVMLKNVTVYGGALAANAPSRANVTHTFTDITAKSYAVTGLQPETAYTYKVKAVYADGSESEWSNTETVTTAMGVTPELIADYNAIDFDEVNVGDTATFNLGILGADLQDVVTVALNDQTGAYSVSAESVAIADAEEGATLVVTYAPTLPGNHSAEIVLSTPGAENVTVTLSGTALMETAAPFLQPASDIATDAFTAEWVDDTDPAYVESYTLVVNNTNPSVVEPVQLLDADFTSENPWTLVNGLYANTTGGYTQLGSSNRLGAVTSPAIDLTDYNGVATIVVSAKYYGSDDSSMKVSLVDGDGTELASETVALTNEDADYTVVLTGNASADNYVQIASIATKKRVMLKNATVYGGSTNAAGAPLRASEQGDADSRTITGITASSYTVENLTEGATFTFKVKALYIDGTESEWSNEETVTLASNATLYGDVDADGYVNAVDLTIISDIVLGNASADAYEGRADLNKDGEVDGIDISIITSLVLGE